MFVNVTIFTNTRQNAAIFLISTNQVRPRRGPAHNNDVNNNMFLYTLTKHNVKLAFVTLVRCQLGGAVGPQCGPHRHRGPVRVFTQKGKGEKHST